MRTVSAKESTIKRNWYIVNAEGKPIGRLAVDIARRLCGKHKPEYTPHVDTGDYIVVINADKVAATGNKLKDKMYYKHTGYPGGLKEATLEKLLDTNPTQVLEKAVKGMLPKTSLGRKMLKKLKLYAGTEHPHAAQQPIEIQ